MCEIINQAEFFHINRRAAWSQYNLMSLNDEIEFGNEINPFFTYFIKSKRTYPVNDKGNIIQVPAIKFLRAVSQNQVSCQNITNIALEIAQHFLMLAREVYWENIREKEFLDCPSRQKCAWLISSFESAQDWLSRLKCKEQNEQYQIVRVIATGRIHKANELLLLGDSEPLTETYKKAQEYWSGVMAKNSREEILFEGKVKVSEIMG